MKKLWRSCNKRKHVGLFSGLLIFLLISPASADLYINLLTVNATDVTKDKEVRHNLPKELSSEDILDTAGLKIDYDVNDESYFVFGKVTLQPKETKTIRIKIRDIWQLDQQEISDIKEQVTASLDRIEGTEYYEIGQLKKESLMQRLDFIVEQQEKFKDNVDKRIDQYRTYRDELDQIRSNALSVKYWRSKPPTDEDARIIKLVIEVSNPSDSFTKKVEPKHYLPSEVKPEHVVERQGFDVRYDALQGQSYLTKEEELKPSESKKYSIGITDIWSVPDENINNLKDRARETYKLLENTEYVESAGFLMASIKQNLERIEESQFEEKDIKEHISDFRSNTKRYASAENDVEVLEELLEAVREDLERSKLKNPLQNIKILKDVGDIAEAVFGSEPKQGNAWKIITFVMIFVGAITLINFAIWSNRSKEKKIPDQQPNKPDGS